MQFEQAGEYITNKLRHELPAHFTYHNIDHTLDVRQAAQLVGQGEKIGSEDMLLLLTAALYHDSGYLKGAIGHEEESCRIVQAVLPGFDYTTQEIALICGMIRATHVPQLPHTLLESILADADLDYFGRDDFFETGSRLFKELNLSGKAMDEVAWNKIQLDFMKEHRYFTATSVNLRLAKKLDNMAQIKAQLIKQPY